MELYANSIYPYGNCAHHTTHFNLLQVIAVFLLCCRNEVNVAIVLMRYSRKTSDRLFTVFLIEAKACKK